MKSIHFLAAAAIGLALAAQARADDEHAAHHATATAPGAAVPSTDGEVRKIDPAQGKLTLRHGRIENLDMPGMTMVFKVADPRLLEGLKAGDKVRFAAESRNGVLTVTAIEPAN